MTEKTPPRFRKTKTDKWAVMAPVADLEAALAADGKIEVQKRSGDWSSFVVASLGKPFDVDGTMMCYGYGPGDDEGGGGGASAGGTPAAANRQRRDRPPPEPNYQNAPTTDTSEPLPEYQGGPEDGWSEY